MNIPPSSVMRLGLIGDNIRRSQAPRLHALAGRLCAIELVYKRLVPGELKLEFDALFERCRQDGFRGVNVTYPYKERVVDKVAIDDAAVRAIAACNTVVFDRAAARGFNTDYTGFVRAFRGTFGAARPGVVAITGAGGVGKAIGFALGDLGASRVRLFDHDRPKAAALRTALSRTFGKLAVEVAGSIAEAAAGADGLVNATPLGMDDKPGSAIPKDAIGGQRWAFDAVYTPLETAFLRDARAGGLEVMSGYELFFYQGVEAFRIFTGRDVDEAELRHRLRQGEPAEE